MPSDRDHSDEALATLARQGDDEAFRVLFERHAPALRKWVKRQIPGLLRRKVAESDVIQMAYLRVHEHLDSFSNRGDGSFKAWLDRIVENQVTDLVRRYFLTAKRALDQEVSGPQPMSGNKQGGREPTPSMVAMGEELERSVEIAMGHLPEDYRAILRHVQGDGMTLAEAGRCMGRSEGAAKQLYARALARLSLLVREKGGPGGG